MAHDGHQVDLHWLTAPPRWPQVTSQRGQEGSKRGPWTPQRPPRGPLRTSRKAQETPKGAQEGAKMAQERSNMAQVGSKVGPEMRKVAKVKLLKKPLVFIVFRAFWPSQDDPKRTPNGI